MTKQKRKNKNQYPKSEVKIEGMSVYQLCRWASLKDAIDIIAEKCEDKKLDFEDFDLEPLKILKYVDSATDILYNKMSEELPS